MSRECPQQQAVLTHGRTHGVARSPRKPIVRDVVPLHESREPHRRDPTVGVTTERDHLVDVGVRVRERRDGELERGLRLESFEGHLPPRVLQLELRSGRADVVGLEVGVEVQLPGPRA